MMGVKPINFRKTIDEAPERAKKKKERTDKLAERTYRDNQRLIDKYER